MARKTTATGKLETRTSRGRLPAQRNPHWMLVAPDTHLGYRPPAVKNREGRWIARRAYVRPGEQRTRYLESALGAADDHAESQPEHTLTFHQATAAAREWARGQVEAERAAARVATDVAVKDAIKVYVIARKKRAAKAGQDAEWRLTRHVLSAPLADVSVSALTEKDLTKWQAGIRRGGRGKQDNAPPLAPATLARLYNDLRAALTAAARKTKAPADVHTAIFEGTRAPEAPDRARPMQILPDADVRRLIAAAEAQDPDFGALLVVLAATGTRFSQAARLTVADLQLDARRVMIPTSAKGKGKKKITHIPMPLPDDVLARLAPLAAGRKGHEPLLQHWRHKQVPGPGIRWERKDRVPWEDSDDVTRPWREVREAAGLAKDLVAYCLRHSSIVRGLRAGLPVRLVASSHDTSVAMIEKHYSAYIVDMSEDLLRRVAVPMVAGDVTPLRIVREQ